MNTTPPLAEAAPIMDQISESTGSVCPSKFPKDAAHLQAPTDKKYSCERHANDPYVLSLQGSRLMRSMEYTDTSQKNDTQLQQLSTAVSPSLKHSRSLGDMVMTKLKSLSTSSTPATDVCTYV